MLAEGVRRRVLLRGDSDLQAVLGEGQNSTLSAASARS